MTKYKILVTYTIDLAYDVEADDLGEAMDQALDLAHDDFSDVIYDGEWDVGEWDVAEDPVSKDNEEDA